MYSVRQVMSLLDENFGKSELCSTAGPRCMSAYSDLIYIDATTIGIISTCSAQCRIIEDCMQSHVKEGYQGLSAVKVGTWESFRHEVSILV